MWWRSRRCRRFIRWNICRAESVRQRQRQPRQGRRRHRHHHLSPRGHRQNGPRQRSAGRRRGAAQAVRARGAARHRCFGDAHDHLGQHNSPTGMIAEKGAAMIREDANRKKKILNFFFFFFFFLKKKKKILRDLIMDTLTFAFPSGLVGFFAQLVDGALGMAFGVLTTPMFLWVPPAQASALVHTAEIFTTGASAPWHIFHRNVDWRLGDTARRAPACGRAGAWFLSNIDATFMRAAGVGLSAADGRLHSVAAAALRRSVKRLADWPAPIGLVAGFLDASGGGGWGPVGPRRWSAPAMRRDRRSARSTRQNSS